jgi:hypothetical protein
MVMRYPNIYKAIKIKVLKTKTFKIVTIMDLEDYDKIFFELCNDNTESIFEIHMQEFVD